MFRRLAIGFAALFGASLHAVAVPIPAGPDAPSEKQFADTMLRMNRKVGVEAYKKIGKRNPKWDADVEAMMEGCAIRFRSLQHPIEHDGPNNGQLLEIAQRVAASGCDDALALYLHGRVLELNGKGKNLRGVYENLIDRLKQAGYNPVWSMYAARRVADRSKGDQSQRYRRMALSFAVDAMVSKDFGPDDQRFVYTEVYRNLVDKLSFEDQQWFKAQFMKRDGIDPWLRGLLLGELGVDEAWHYRGGGFANTVTDEGWKKFREHLEKAAKILVETHLRRPDRPEAARRLIPVAMAGHAPAGTDERYWFDQAVKAQFDFLPAYKALMYSMRPRWGGSHQAMVAFGREAVDTGRFDTNVPRTMWDAMQGITADFNHDKAMAFRMPGLAEGLDKMFAGYQAQPGMEANIPWNLSFRAAIAWRTGRYADAKKFLDELGDKLNPVPFERVGAMPRRAIGEVYLLAGPESPAVQAAFALLREGEEREGFEALQAVRPRLKSEQAKTYLKHLLALVRVGRDLAAGQWVDIQPDADLSGWGPVSGTWTVDKFGGLRGDSSTRGLLILLDRPLGPSLVLEGDLEFTDTRYAVNHSGGPVFNAVGAEDNFSALFYKDEDKAFWRQGLRHGDDAARARVKQRNHFRLVLLNGTAEAWLNGKRVLGPERYDPEPGGRIGIGGHYWFEGATVTVRNLRAKRIDKQPEPPNAAPLADALKPGKGPLLHLPLSAAPGDSDILTGQGALAHQARVLGDVAWRDGAALFNGKNASIDTGFDRDLKVWTLSVRVRAAEAPKNGYPTGPVHREKAMGISWNHSDGAGRGAAQVRVKGQWHFVKFGDLKGKTWYHLTATYDGDTLRTYRDGKPVGEKAGLGGPPDAEDVTLKIGRHALWGAHFAGEVKDLRVYDRVLSAEEIEALFEAK